MAEAVLILGESGSGKSTAIKTLNPAHTMIICPDEKTLPFAGAKKMYTTKYTSGSNYSVKDSNFIQTTKFSDIYKILELVSDKKKSVTSVVIDTVSHAMVKSVMDKIMVESWDKFKIFAKELYDLVKMVPRLRDDLIVIITAHVEAEMSLDGTKRLTFKVPAGKLTKEAIVPESLFTTVLFSKAIVDDSSNNIYYFETKTDGTNSCKSPDGMFPADKIPNDYQYVIDCMNAYFEGKPAPTKKIVAIKQASDNF